MKPEELDRLIHRYFEGDLSPEEEGLLWSVVRIDPSAADRFVELSELESAMVESLRAEEATPPEVKSTRRDSRRHTRVMAAVVERRPVWPLFFAAGLMIGFVALLVRSAEKPQPAVAVRAPEPPKPKPPEEVRPVAPEPVPPKRVETRPVDPPATTPRQPLPPTPQTKPVDAPPEAPKPPDKPQPPPVEPPATPKETRIADATIRKVDGDVVDDAGVPAKAAQSLFSGRGLEARRGSAVVALADGTEVELRPGTKLDQLLVTAEQKRLVFSRGVLSANVAKQPAKTPLVFQTPHAEVAVLGTRFVIEIGKDATRVDVHEGRVRCTRLPDRAFAEVAAGRYAVAGKGPAPSAKPIPVVRSFQDGVAPTPDYRGTTDTMISSVEPNETYGRIEQLQLQRLNAQQTALIRWDLSSIPAGSRVVSAELTFWVTGKLVGDCKIHALNLPFDEYDATYRLPRPNLSWRTPGAQGEQDRGTRPIALLAPEKPGFATVLITDLGVVQNWINAPKENFGILIAGPDANIWGVESRETAVPDRRPKLTITYISGK